MKKIAEAAAAVLLALTLTGCESEREQCEAAGGTYMKTGSSIMPITTYISSGNTLVPQTQWIPYDTYECQGVQ